MLREICTNLVGGILKFKKKKKKMFYRHICTKHYFMTKAKLNYQPSKGRLSYHLCVKCFSQLSFDSEVYTKSATAADFVYTSE